MFSIIFGGSGKKSKKKIKGPGNLMLNILLLTSTSLLNDEINMYLVKIGPNFVCLAVTRGSNYE